MPNRLTMGFDKFTEVEKTRFPEGELKIDAELILFESKTPCQ